METPGKIAAIVDIQSQSEALYAWAWDQVQWRVALLGKPQLSPRPLTDASEVRLSVLYWSV